MLYYDIPVKSSESEIGPEIESSTYSALFFLFLLDFSPNIWNRAEIGLVK